METAEIARKALEILDRDGWGRGKFGDYIFDADGNPVSYGAHCIGGAWTMAQGAASWIDEENGSYRELWEMIAAMFPDQDVRAYISSFKQDDPICQIISWNDNFAAEEDVRTVLEKLAAG